MARAVGLIAARVTLPCAGTKSGHVSNEFHWRWIGTGSPTITDWGVLCQRVKDFYLHSFGSAHQVGLFLGPQISPAANASEVALYQIDVADPHHYYGSPVHVESWTCAGAGSGTSQANEIAACLSMRADYGTDPEHEGRSRPRASDRGRVYIGPFNQLAMDEVTIADGRKFAVLSPTLVTTLGQAINYLWALSTANWVLSVWSRAEGVFKNVVDYAIDNLIDSQRRREVRDPLQTWVPLGP